MQIFVESSLNSKIPGLISVIPVYQIWKCASLDYRELQSLTRILMKVWIPDSGIIDVIQNHAGPLSTTVTFKPLTGD